MGGPSPIAMPVLRPTLLLIALALAPACQIERADGDEAADAETADAPTRQTAYADPFYEGDDALAPDVRQRERYSRRWYATLASDSARVDSALVRRAQAGFRETAARIRPQAFQANARPSLPVGGDVAGPTVLRVQVLLDRAGFSPGSIDGQWGDNLEKAVFWFQRNEGLRPSGVVDEATYRRLVERAGGQDQPVRRHRLTAEDVAGPFVEIPSDIYAKAELEALSYESLAEKLGERFHADPDLLRRLNPGQDLSQLAAGTELLVPNVGERPQRPVARVAVSGDGNYLHAMGPDGRIAYHFPTTLGAKYDPSPQGDFRITNVARDPAWRYQPRILANVPDDQPEATIPPGPNNAVGAVWMALSEPHYGIHGTASPESIGYASSAGCVRLTNWDALTLAGAVRAGTPVHFRDVAGREGDAAGADSTRAAPRRDTTTQEV